MGDGRFRAICGSGWMDSAIVPPVRDRPAEILPAAVDSCSSSRSDGLPLAVLTIRAEAALVENHGGEIQGAPQCVERAAVILQRWSNRGRGLLLSGGPTKTETGITVGLMRRR